MYGWKKEDDFEIRGTIALYIGNEISGGVNPWAILTNQEVDELCKIRT